MISLTGSSNGHRGCAAQGCTNTCNKGLLCEPHHQEWTEAGRPIGWVPSSNHVFSGTGSAEVPRSKGPTPKPKRRCRIEECDAPMEARGLCSRHYQRERRRDAGVEPRFLEPVPKDRQCSTEGCDRPFSAKGRCQSHYKQWRRRLAAQERAA